MDNESGAFANWAVEGFEAIGIPQYAAVMRKLQALFPGGVIPEDPNEREQLASELGEENLEEIEKGFWDRYNSHGREIPDKLYQYLSGK